tara:strand:+ start:103 stop:807 length:705 start_codon:yes stop_codon:yes gene_type:complete
MSLNNIPVVAIIPARLGSKGVKNKNLYKINHKPLIYYTIIAAKNSKFIDHIYLSSESNLILSYAEKYKIKRIKRQKKYSSDKSTASEVMLDASKKLEKILYNQNPFIIYLQPTSPLRDTLHIDKAFKILSKVHNSSLVSVVKSKETPYKMFTLNKNKKLKSIFDEKLSNFNRQSLPQTYKANGALYIFRLFNFLKNNSFPSNNSIPYLMNDVESLDVDTYGDIKKVELFLKNKL